MFDPVFLKSGDTLPGGKYVLIQTLGRGAMGIVFWATDQHLHRDVALKFLSDRARQYPEVKQRFLREARALAKIQNPHVVQVYEVSADDADELFIAMEYLVGSDLAARLATGWRPSVAEAIELGLQACAALMAAHRQGIVHRDLKPSNLFLTREGVLKVVDFGVSKMLNEPRLTRTGEALGTPYYMSPEQVRCEPDLDQRTDVWSLGVIFYELLCGSRPFEGTTIGEVMSGILSEAPRTLEARGVCVPPALGEVILRCLEKDRARRFPDVQALARALQGLPTATPQTSEPTLHPKAEPPDQFASTLASEPSPPVRVEPAAHTTRAATSSASRSMYVLGGALAGAVLASVVVLAVAWGRREPTTAVHGLAPAAQRSPVLPARESELHAKAIDLAPPGPVSAKAARETSQPPAAHPAPRQSSPARSQGRPLAPALSQEAVVRDAPASSAAEAAPRASASARNATSTNGWLPAEPAGAAVSPYAERPVEQ